jgi:transcription-repair coupling factor (superfamily II helicase)
MLDTLPRIAPAGQKTRCPALPDGLDAAVLAGLAQAGHTLLVLTADAQAAQRLKAELPWFAPDIKAALLPDWETLPYDHFSPHGELVSERLATLWQIHRGECQVVIAPVSTAMTRLSPVSYLLGRTFLLQSKQQLDVEQLRADMVMAGYSHVTQVMAPGEFSIRGGLVDLFPMGSPLPYRIDLFDKEIDSLRTFDPDSQRTLYPVPEIRMLPAREYPADESGVTAFRQHYRERMEGDPSKSRIYKDVSANLFPAGIEYYLPLFFDETATLFDYVGESALVVLHRDVAGAADTFWKDVQNRYHMAQGDPERPVLPPADVFLRQDEFLGRIKPYSRIEIPAGDADSTVLQLPDLAVERRADNPLHKLAHYLQPAASACC